MSALGCPPAFLEKVAATLHPKLQQISIILLVRYIRSAWEIYMDSRGDSFSQKTESENSS